MCEHSKYCITITQHIKKKLYSSQMKEINKERKIEGKKIQGKQNVSHTKAVNLHS
jgi:hypothetical protein